MIRFLLFAIVFYLFVLVVTAVLRSIFGMRRQRPKPGGPQQDETAPAKKKIEYTNVADAKFEDVKRSKSSQESKQN